MNGIQTWSAAIVGGLGAGAALAAITPTKDEKIQTAITGGLALAGLGVGALLLTKAPDSLPGVILGTGAVVAGTGLAAATAGSRLVDQLN